MNSSTDLAGKAGLTSRTPPRAPYACNWHDVVEIEAEIVVQRRVPSVRCRNLKECITVGRSAHDRLGREIAAAARSIFDNERLPEVLRKPLADQSRADIERPAGGIANQKVDRSRGVRCGSPGSNRRKHNSAGCQMQKDTTANLHHQHFRQSAIQFSQKAVPLIKTGCAPPAGAKSC